MGLGILKGIGKAVDTVGDLLKHDSKVVKFGTAASILASPLAVPWAAKKVVSGVMGGGEPSPEELALAQHQAYAQATGSGYAAPTPTIVPGMTPTSTQPQFDPTIPMSRIPYGVNPSQQALTPVAPAYQQQPIPAASGAQIDPATVTDPNERQPGMSISDAELSTIADPNFNVFGETLTGIASENPQQAGLYQETGATDTATQIDQLTGKI